jgi:hypothetical protein
MPLAPSASSRRWLKPIAKGVIVGKVLRIRCSTLDDSAGLPRSLTNGARRGRTARRGVVYEPALICRSSCRRVLARAYRVPPPLRLRVLLIVGGPLLKRPHVAVWITELRVEDAAHVALQFGLRATPDRWVLPCVECGKPNARERRARHQVRRLVGDATGEVRA